MAIKLNEQHVGWKEVDRIMQNLAGQVQQSRFKPHVLVGISRGGLIPVRLLGDHLDVDRMGTMRMQRYGKTVGKTSRKPVISQPVSVGVRGKKVLLVDDVVDGGHSLKAAVEHLRRRGATEVRIATLHFKPHSVITPHFFARRTTSWLVYPWEEKEFARLVARMKAEGKGAKGS